MKINRIKIQNVIGIESIDLDLSGAKIHCFVGPNGAGKSTIRDSVSWCFLGSCRGLKTKDQMADLVRNGQKKAVVEVMVDKGNDTYTYKQSRTLKTQSKGVELPPDKADLLRIVLDPYDFMNRSQDSQRLLLNHVLKLEKPDKKLLQDRLGKTDQHKALINVCVKHGFEKAENEAVMSRREAKRDLQGIVLDKPGATYEAGGQVFRLADIDPGQVKKQLGKLEAEKEALLVKKGEAKGSGNSDVEYLKKTVDRLEDQIKALKSGQKNPEKFRKEIAKLQADIKAVAEQKNKLTAKAVLDRVEQCPVYGIDCPAKDQINEMIEGQEAESEEADKKIQEYDDHIAGQEYLIKKKRGVLDDAEESERQRQFTADELKKAKATLKEAKASPAKQDLNVEDIEKQITAIGARIENGSGLFRAVGAFEQGLKQYEENQTRAESLREEIALYDEAAKFFGPDGIVKELIAAGLAKINDRIKTVGLLDVEINEELRPTLKDHPLPSKSELLRMGVVIQEAISYLTGTKLLFVDEADVLDPTNRSFLIQSLYKVRDDYDTIMVFSTIGDKEVLPSPVPEIQMWLVEGGRVVDVRNKRKAA